jgi:hypothetical protein
MKRNFAKCPETVDHYKMTDSTRGKPHLPIEEKRDVHTWGQGDSDTYLKAEYM